MLEAFAPTSHHKNGLLSHEPRLHHRQPDLRCRQCCRSCADVGSAGSRGATGIVKNNRQARASGRTLEKRMSKESVKRVKEYIARRKIVRGLDFEHIHAFDLGGNHGVELLLSDMEAIISAAAPQVVADELTNEQIKALVIKVGNEVFAEGYENYTQEDEEFYPALIRAALQAAPVQAQEQSNQTLMNKEIELAIALGKAQGTLRFIATVSKDKHIAEKALEAATASPDFAPVQPVAVPDGPSAEDYSDMLRDFFFRYAAGGYNDDGGLVPLAKAKDKLQWVIDEEGKHAAPAAQGDAETDMFLRGVIAALGALAPHCQHGDVIHDEIVRSVGKEALYRTAEPEDVVWAGLDPEFYAAISAKAAS